MIDPNIIKPYPDLRAQECMTAFASGTSPVAILNLDNNLEIALNLIKPRTLNELRANGIPVLESQRVLLNLWGIIEMVENNRYRFIPPLLVGEKLDAVRYKTKRLASLLLENSQSEIDTFLMVVAEANWQSHQFTLLASLVLDGLIWDQMATHKLVDNIDFSQMETGSEYWSGLAWVTYPEKNFRLGTNSYTTGDYYINQSWTPASLPLQSSVNQFHLDALIKFIDRGPTAISTEEQKQLTALDFIMGQNCLIPILRNKDPIYQQGLHLASHIVQILRDELQSLDIAELIEADFKAALIIFFHEVYPTMLENLIEKGIAIPGVLEGEESAPLSPSFFISGKEKSS